MHKIYSLKAWRKDTTFHF